MNASTPPRCPCAPHRARAQSRVHPGPLPHWLSVDFNQTAAPSTSAAEGKQIPQLEGQLEM
eukprot:8056365-Pyramimonas_sp.AAC.1